MAGRTRHVLGLVLLAVTAAGVGPAGAATTWVFLETIAATNGTINPWTGGDCDNVWTVTGSAFAQSTNWNYGAGHPCGLQFKQGTASLSDNMLTTAQGVGATGGAAFAEFYLSASGLSAANTGWTFQLDAGAGYVTRLSELVGTNHNWRLYHYDLQPSERVSNLHLRFQFAGGVSSNRINLDRIALGVVTATNGPDTNAFGGTLALGRPTANSVTVNVLADTDTVGYLEFGPQSGTYASQTPVTHFLAGQPTEVLLGSLPANTRCYYRLRHDGTGSTSYLADTERSSMTQRPPGSTFTFCIQGDSHPERLNVMFNAELYARTLRTAAADRPDFFLTIGDVHGGEICRQQSLHDDATGHPGRLCRRS
jgi:hypothetical protein